MPIIDGQSPAHTEFARESRRLRPSRRLATGVGLATAAVVAGLIVNTGSVSAFSGGAATRTWVSGVGDDANPCSRTAPCKTFSGAISKTAAGGSISVLDPGGFGAVTITKSITLEADGDMGSIIVSGTNGININTANAADTVTIRGLSLLGGIEPTQTNMGLAGIKVFAAGTVNIERTKINGMSAPCVDVSPTATTTKVFISDSTLSNCQKGSSGGGVYLNPTGTARVRALITNTTIANNLVGVRAEQNAKATIQNSAISGSTGHGVVVASANGTASEIFLDSTTISNCAGAGIFATGTGATAILSNVSLAGNAKGIRYSSGGVVKSYGNNHNSDDGAPGKTLTPQ